MITVYGQPRGRYAEADLERFARAALLVGGRRHLDAHDHLAPPVARRIPLTADLDTAIEDIAATDGDVVVLASGDPGFFGIVRALAERCGPQALDVRPAPSSVSLAFAAAGLAWDDAVVASAHGRDPRPAVAACRRHPKVAVLTAPGFGPADLGAALGGLERTVVVAEDLGSPAERVTTTDVAGLTSGQWRQPAVVLVVDPDRQVGAPRAIAGPDRPDGWALGDDAFAHRDGMITKAEIRAVVLGWLGPGTGDLVWDVGAGSGAVAVECARLGAAVIAIERDPDQQERIAANAARHDVPVQVIAGTAPGVLAGLPDPDAALVGGGGTSVVAAVAERARRACVVTLATVERVGPALRALGDAGLEVTGTQIAASRLAPLPGGGHRLAALNPVTVLLGTRPR